MKILYILPYRTFSSVFAATTIGHLARSGHEVDLMWYARDKSRLHISTKEKNVRFHFVNSVSVSIPNLVTEFPYFLSLEKTVKEINPDIIHINNLPFLTTFQATKIAKKLGIKSVIQVHGVLGYRSLLLNLAQKVYIYTFGSFIFHKNNRVICLTVKDAEEVIRYGCPPEKIRIIPNGVNVDVFRPCGGEVSDLVLWSGRFIQQKGLGYLLKALQIIVRKKRYPKIKLIMTGDGPLLPKIYGLAKKYRITENILFRGMVPREEIPILMNKASIYVLPSLKEGMPYALLEAMACGKAVIGSDISGINGVITHETNGIIVPPRDPEALANAIMLLLEDKNLRMKLGHNARRLMVEKYDLNMTSQKIEKVYGEAMSEIK